MVRSRPWSLATHHTRLRSQARQLLCVRLRVTRRLRLWSVGSWSACPAPDWSERSSNTARPAEKLDRFGLVAASSKEN